MAFFVWRFCRVVIVWWIILRRDFGDCKEKKRFRGRNFLARIVVGFVGEGEGEDGAFVVVVEPDAAVVGLDDVFDDGETESGAALFAGAGFVDAEEAFEDALLGVFWDAGSVVGDVDGDVVVVGVGGGVDADVAAGFAVFDAVVDEVLDDLVDSVGVCPDLGFGLNFGGECDGLGFGAVLEVVEDSLDEGGELDLGVVHSDLAGFELGEGEEVFDEEGEAVGVFLDFLEESFMVLRVGGVSVEERFDAAFDHGERSSEFVVDVGDEVFAFVFEEFDLGEVVEEDDDAGLGVGVFEACGADGEVAVFCGGWEVEFSAGDGALVGGGLDDFMEFVGADGF